MKIEFCFKTALIRSQNEEDIKEIDEKKVSAEENAGETEVIDALLEKARYFCKIGSNDAFEVYTEICGMKKVTIGKKIDAYMEQARLHLFFMNLEGAKEAIDTAKKFNDDGGDWDRRNRLKVFLLTIYID